LPVEWFGIFWTALWLFSCNCAGIGGGGTMVPNIRIIFNFGVKDAIALSNATIAVAALMRYLVNFRKNHPLKFDTLGKPAGLIVDYNITLIMMPMLIVGSAVGVVVNYILPEPAIISVLIVSLVYIVITTAIKLVKMIK
jgi:uncharacterized membrane protein YfcA